jgi:hypothetical protein
MHTGRNILLVVSTIVLAVLSAIALLVLVLGFDGLVVATAAVVAVLALYLLIVRPWHRRWGASRREATEPLPGDDLVPCGSSTTRAIAIDAPPEAVWPWLIQIGWGRAGWYSYDRIDNDGQPSADLIDPELQHLAVGDRILMTPDMGFVVTELDPPNHLVALTDDGTTSWCLAVRSGPGDTSRLCSRFRARLALTPASALWIAVADPGVFVMERKMLKGIAQRAETANQQRSSHVDAAR